MSRKDKVIAETLGEEETLSPSDLYNTDFKSFMVGGYDKNGVDTMLERAADVLGALANEVRELRKDNEELKELVNFYRETEEGLREALISAQKLGENVLASAKHEADAIVQEARLAKAKTYRAAATVPTALKAEIDALQAVRDRLRSDLKSVLDTHSALLENIESAKGMEVSALVDFDDLHPASEDEDLSRPELTPGDGGGDDDGTDAEE
jgi:cell division initiation protein